MSNYAYGKLSSYGLQALARCAARARDPDRIGSLLRSVDFFDSVRRCCPMSVPDGYTLLRGVGREFSERTVDPMITLWGRHAEPALQKLCMSLLCDIAPLRAAGFLLDAATNPLLDTEVRGIAALALGKIRTPRTRRAWPRR